MPAPWSAARSPTGPATSTRPRCWSTYLPRRGCSARRSSVPSRPISTFRDEEEALARANDTEYGLVAYVFTRDHARVLRVSEALEFGMVGINTGIVSNPAAPFGGVKHSGFGREGGFEGIEEYLETKYVGSAL